MITFVSGTRVELPVPLIDALSAFRADVFLQRLRWQVPGQEQPGVEQDQFDTAETVYVIAQSQYGTVCGCARLLPTTRPYLLKDVFSHLMPEGLAACAPDVWELSRFAADGRCVQDSGQSLGRAVFAEALRVASQRGAAKVVGVVSAHVKRFILGLGLPLATLGPTVECDGDLICACELPVGESLERLEFTAMQHAERRSDSTRPPPSTGVGEYVRPSMPESSSLLSALMASALVGSVAALTPAPVRAAAPSDPLVEALIDAMTREEKLGMLIGSPFAGPPDPAGMSVGYLAGVPRLGIPCLRFADGPAGVRANNFAFTATALPAPIALASAFSIELATAYGETLGHEVQARGEDVLFAPMLNLVRVPLAGRNFETFGEDPILQAELGTAQVEGIQSQGTIAVVKHFAANNQERNRMWVSANVEPQALREMELPAFEGAVVRAGVLGVMCAYNRLNGTYACENEPLLTGVLRREWGFEGFVVSDYGANRSARAALLAGMDIEFLTGFFSGFTLPVFPGFPPLSGGPSLADLLATGALSETALDGAVRHVLASMSRAGLLNEACPMGCAATTRQRPDWNGQRGAALAREVAERGAVLLKNDRNMLPLRQRDLDGLLVVGPTAEVPLYGGGGSSRVLVDRSLLRSPVDELAARSRTKVRYLPGIELDGEAIPSSALRLDATGSTFGLLRTNAPLGTTQVDPQISFLDAAALTISPQADHWTWSGYLVAPTSGRYELRLQAQSTSAGAGDGSWSAEAVLDDTTVIGSIAGLSTVNASLLPTARGLQNTGLAVDLEAGVPRHITLQARGPSAGSLQLQLAWITPARRRLAFQDATAAAATAPAVVVFAYDEAVEGADRPALALPRDQDALIHALATANPRTVVVLNTGGAITMPWRDHVRSILQMWYPGQHGAEATAALLSGERVPSGKLPITFPMRLEDNPTYTPDGRRYPGMPASDGAPSEQYYDEGIYVGYRWYDAHGIAPLYPFGHGLSYTIFRYSDPQVRLLRDGLEISFVVRNIGSTTAIETAQVYLGRSPLAGDSTPLKKLVAFRHVELGPNQAQRIRVPVDSRALSYWDTKAGRWRIAGGERSLSVGSSSRDIRLVSSVRVEPSW